MMYKKTCDFNAAECMIWMYKYNPEKVDIYIQGDCPQHLISLVHTNHLIFPEGWYYANDTKTIKRKDGNVYVRVIIKE